MSNDLISHAELDGMPMISKKHKGGMNCDRDMCFHNIWNGIPCEECPCYEKEGEKDNDNNT